MSDSLEPALNGRSAKLLKFLIDRYIRDGQPVGSRTLSKDSGLDLSPATIRNVMSDLTDMGLVCSPHTSAGRIPTVRGYRLFVDTMLSVQPLSSPELLGLREGIGEQDTDPNQLIETASSLLSGLTQMAGVVTTPKEQVASLRQIEFLKLSGRQVLAILVINNQNVQNRILELDRDFSPADLQAAANYLNAHYAGKELTEVRRALLGEMRSTRESMNQMMLDAVTIAEQALKPAEQPDYVLAGQTNLMDFADLADVSKLRELFEAFNRKRDLLHLLDQCTEANGVQIFIGEESGYQVLDGCSVVTAPYAADGDTIGVLGVIGPTRMNYERVIPIVDATAKVLGAALNHK